MILGHTNARENEAAYSKQIQGAIAYCRDTDTSGMEEGCYPQDGDGFIVLINQRHTRSREEKPPEVHREYAELRYMVSGGEYMRFCPSGGDGKVLRDCLEKEGTLYYKENPGSDEAILPLVPGPYGMFFSEDVYRSFYQVDGPEDIKKIAIKIGMSTP